MSAPCNCSCKCCRIVAKLKARRAARRRQRAAEIDYGIALGLAALKRDSKPTKAVTK